MFLKCSDADRVSFKLFHQTDDDYENADYLDQVAKDEEDGTLLLSVLTENMFICDQ